MEGFIYKGIPMRYEIDNLGTITLALKRLIQTNEIQYYNMNKQITFYNNQNQIIASNIVEFQDYHKRNMPKSVYFNTLKPQGDTSKVSGVFMAVQYEKHMDVWTYDVTHEEETFVHSCKHKYTLQGTFHLPQYDYPSSLDKAIQAYVKISKYALRIESSYYFGKFRMTSEKLKGLSQIDHTYEELYSLLYAPFGGMGTWMDGPLYSANKTNTMKEYREITSNLSRSIMQVRCAYVNQKSSLI